MAKTRFPNYLKAVQDSEASYTQGFRSSPEFATRLNLDDLPERKADRITMSDEEFELKYPKKPRTPRTLGV